MNPARANILRRVRQALRQPAPAPAPAPKNPIWPPITDLEATFRQEFTALRGELIENLPAFLDQFTQIHFAPSAYPLLGEGLPPSLGSQTPPSGSALFGEGLPTPPSGSALFGEGLPTPPSGGPQVSSAVSSTNESSPDLRSDSVRGRETGAQQGASSVRGRQTGAQHSSRSVPVHQAELAVTACDFVLARTGSILLSSRSGGGRLPSVLPPVHLVLARRDQLLRDLDEALPLLRQRYQASWPSMISLITGPSRTADIEKVLVMGAHGPKRLALCFVP